MSDGAVSRGQFLRHLARRTGAQARALWAGPPQPVVAATAVGATPAVRLIAGQPVFLWQSQGAVLARLARCPRDGLPLYHQPGPGSGSFLCTNCGTLTAADLTVVSTRTEAERIYLNLPV